MCDQQSLRSDCAYAQSDQSLCYSLEYSFTVELLTKQQLEFLSSTGGCTVLSESTVTTHENTILLEITCRGSYWSFVLKLQTSENQNQALSSVLCIAPDKDIL